MKRRIIGSKRLALLAVTAMMTVSLWCTAAHADDDRMEEARRIIVYTTTS